MAKPARTDLPARMRVLAALTGRMTSAELGERIGMNSYSVARSLCELHERGLVHQVGDVKTKSGWKRKVWERTPLRSGRVDIGPLMQAWPIPVAFPPTVPGVPRIVLGILHIEKDGSGERHHV